MRCHCHPEVQTPIRVLAKLCFPKRHVSQIARQLIEQDPEQPGAIEQLNMGEGKTRVITPMLALHWTRGKQQVVGAA